MCTHHQPGLLKRMSCVLFFTFSHCCVCLHTCNSVHRILNVSLSAGSPPAALSMSMFAPLATQVVPESSMEHVASVTTSFRATLTVSSVTRYICFLPPHQVNSGAEVAWRLSDWPTVGCWHCLHVRDPDRLSAARPGPLCCWCVHCVYHWQCPCLGPEACTWNEIKLLLHVTVACLLMLPLWMKTAGLKKSLWQKEGSWLAILHSPLHCRPCRCFWCCRWWWCCCCGCCCGRLCCCLCCQSCGRCRHGRRCCCLCCSSD